MLVALSIMEACARDVGVDFENAIRSAGNADSAEPTNPVVEGYFSRSPQMRDVGVMGFTASGTGATLNFTRIG